MTDLLVRKEGQAGRLTLNRPKVLNALSWDMALGIEQALLDWAVRCYSNKWVSKPKIC